MEEFGDLDLDLDDLDNQFENACGASGDETFIAKHTPPPGFSSSTSSAPPIVLDSSIKRCARCHERGLEYLILSRESLESCWPCLEDGVASRFKLGMNRIRDRHGVVRVGLAFSGGLSSWTILTLLSELRGGGLGTRQIKLFEGEVILIDESLAVSTIVSSSMKGGGEGLMSEDQIRSHTLKAIEDLQTIIPSQYQMPFHAIPLEDVFSDSDFECASIAGEEEEQKNARLRKLKREKLRTLFSSIATLSSKEDLLVSLRTRLLFQTCSKLGLERLLVGDNDITQAVKVMTATCSGRGMAVPHEISFASEVRYDAFTSSSEKENENKEKGKGKGKKGIIILRPLRELTLQEIDIFLLRHSGITQVFSGIESGSKDGTGVQVPITSTPSCSTTIFVPSIYHTSVLPSATRKSSIHRLVKDFILGLQKDFPQTIHPILRTADKLCLPSTSSSSSTSSFSKRPQASVDKRSRRGKPAMLTPLEVARVPDAIPVCSLCLLPFHPEVLSEGVSFIRLKTSSSSSTEEPHAVTGTNLTLFFFPLPQLTLSLSPSSSHNFYL
jgi:hypothetical protein